jgi:hypothetical protein
MWEGDQMTTIYKHVLPVGEMTAINCVRPISVIEQNGEITVYTLQDEDLNKELLFYVAGTGWNMDQDILRFNFLGTVKIGALVWHVFYRGKAV